MNLLEAIATVMEMKNDITDLKQKAIMKLEDVPEFGMDEINAFLDWGGQDKEKFQRILTTDNLVNLLKEIKG